MKNNKTLLALLLASSMVLVNCSQNDDKDKKAKSGDIETKSEKVDLSSYKAINEVVMVYSAQSSLFRKEAFDQLLSEAELIEMTQSLNDKKELSETGRKDFLKELPSDLLKKTVIQYTFKAGLIERMDIPELSTTTAYKHSLCENFAASAECELSEIKEGQFFSEITSPSFDGTEEKTQIKQTLSSNSKSSFIIDAETSVNGITDQSKTLYTMTTIDGVKYTIGQQINCGTESLECISTLSVFKVTK